MILSTVCKICGGRAAARYPGDDPENGPARPYCSEGHAPCYRCGTQFLAIERVGPLSDPDGFGDIPASTFENEWCPACVREHRTVFCGCGMEGTHVHHTEDSDSEWACCGGSMCCSEANV